MTESKRSARHLLTSCTCVSYAVTLRFVVNGLHNLRAAPGTSNESACALQAPLSQLVVAAAAAAASTEESTNTSPYTEAGAVHVKSIETTALEVVKAMAMALGVEGTKVRWGRCRGGRANVNGRAHGVQTCAWP